MSIEPQVSGRITEIAFQDGADLKKGDKLFTIDPRPYEAALAGAEAQYEKDKALAANARANAVRQEKLFEQKLISPADYDQARYTADSQGRGGEDRRRRGGDRQAQPGVLLDRVAD